MKRGTKVIDHQGFEGRVLGPEDSQEYEHNRPGSRWALVDYAENGQWWIGGEFLEVIQ